MQAVRTPRTRCLRSGSKMRRSSRSFNRGRKHPASAVGFQRGTAGDFQSIETDLERIEGNVSSIYEFAPSQSLSLFVGVSCVGSIIRGGDNTLGSSGRTVRGVKHAYLSYVQVIEDAGVMSLTCRLKRSATWVPDNIHVLFMTWEDVV